MVLFFSRRQLPSTYLVAACLFLLLSLLFSLVACQAPVNTTEGGTESGTSAPETAPHTTLTVPETTSAPKPIPEDPAAFDGVLIHSVYGTGKNGKDAVISCGFIQLYNESDRDISLHRASLYYKTDNGAGFTEFAFPEDAVIPSQGYYLLRSNPASGFSEENAILAIDNADVTFPILIDHKEITLILAPSYREFDPTLPYDAFEDINSIFAASDTPTDFHYAVHDLSRNKIAVRTAPTAYSGFHTVNLTKRATAELTALTPKTASGAVNRVVASRLDEVFFSAPAGFYPQTLLLSLSCKDGYTVYYTLDGSDPRDPDNPERTPYFAPLTLTSTAAMAWGEVTKTWGALHHAATPTEALLPGAHVIKAYATDGINESAVFTNSYFIATGLCDYQLPIMSFSIPIDDMFGGSGFYSNFMPSGDITAPRPRGLGMMEIFDENGVRVGYSNVEAAVSGNGSSHTAMKSIRLYYKGKLNEEGGRFGSLHYDLFAGLARDADGNPITSFDRLLLRNSGNDCGNSYIRDAYMQRVSSGLSVDTMATRSVLLFVNGEFFGVYNARERYSPEYVESHYGVDKDNVALLESDYSQVHTNQNAPFVLMSGEEADADDFNALVDYIRQNDMADPFHYEYVTALLDINSFIDMWVVHLYFNATDWPGNNIKVFRNNDPLDPSGMDTKWHFTLLDLDMGLSYFDYTSAAYDIFYSFNRGSVVGNMMCDLMENEDFKAQFFCRYVTLVNEYFTPGYLSEVFEELYSERSPLVTLQMARWGREGAHINTWLREAEKIRLFIKTRNEYAIKALYRHFGINESDMDALLYPRLSLIFNPAHVSVKVNGDEITKQTNLIAAWGEALLIELIPREGCSITETTVNFQTVRETTFTLTLTKDCTLRIQTEAEESTSQAPSG